MEDRQCQNNISWLLGSVDANIGIHIRGFRRAAKLWLYLEKVYQQSNLVRKVQIEHDISCYSQGEIKVEEYYEGFK